MSRHSLRHLPKINKLKCHVVSRHLPRLKRPLCQRFEETCTHVLVQSCRARRMRWSYFRFTPGVTFGDAMTQHRAHATPARQGRKKLGRAHLRPALTPPRPRAPTEVEENYSVAKRRRVAVIRLGKQASFCSVLRACTCGAVLKKWSVEPTHTQ